MLQVVVRAITDEEGKPAYQYCLVNNYITCSYNHDDLAIFKSEEKANEFIAIIEDLEKKAGIKRPQHVNGF